MRARPIIRRLSVSQTSGTGLIDRAHAGISVYKMGTLAGEEASAAAVGVVMALDHHAGRQEAPGIKELIVGLGGLVGPDIAGSIARN